ALQKGALASITRSLATALAEHAVTVNTVSPGTGRTPTRQPVPPPRHRACRSVDRWSRPRTGRAPTRQPVRRPGTGRAPTRQPVSPIRHRTHADRSTGVPTWHRACQSVNR
ncbi:SDR family oxidoreductase, partial [Streptomyces cellulosae]